MKKESERGGGGGDNIVKRDGSMKWESEERVGGKEGKGCEEGVMKDKD